MPAHIKLLNLFFLCVNMIYMMIEFMLLNLIIIFDKCHLIISFIVISVVKMMGKKIRTLNNVDRI